MSSNGKSPLLIAQAIVTSSSAFIGPSPKEKGAICGATVVDNRKDREYNDQRVFFFFLCHLKRRIQMISQFHVFPSNMKVKKSNYASYRYKNTSIH